MSLVPLFAKLAIGAATVAYGTYLGMRLTRNAARLHHWVWQRSALGVFGLGPSRRPAHLLWATLLGHRWLRGQVGGLAVSVRFQPHNDRVRIRVWDPEDRPLASLPPDQAAALQALYPERTLDPHTLQRRVDLAIGRRQPAEVTEQLTRALGLALIHVNDAPTLASRLTALAQTAQPSPLPAPVRIAAIAQLAQVAPLALPTACTPLLEDPDRSVRLAAGLALGETGRDALLTLGLDPDTPVAQWEPALGAAVQGPQGLERARAVLTHPDGVRRALALRALADGPDIAAVPMLRAGLTDPHPAVRLPAAQGLQRFGTVADVEALRDAAAAHRLDRPLARAVDRAVATIQMGLRHRDAGRLAVAEPAQDEGRLSLPTEEGGELSVARELDGT